MKSEADNPGEWVEPKERNTASPGQKNYPREAILYVEFYNFTARLAGNFKNFAGFFKFLLLVERKDYIIQIKLNGVRVWQNLRL